jgi:hypothetical protein
LCSAGARRKRLCGDFEVEARWVQHDIAINDSSRPQRCTHAHQQRVTWTLVPETRHAARGRLNSERLTTRQRRTRLTPVTGVALHLIAVAVKEVRL